jgi:hypothetical protein
VKYIKKNKDTKEAKYIKETSQMALKWAWDFDSFYKQLDHRSGKKKTNKGLTWAWAFGHLLQARHWANNGPKKEPIKGRYGFGPSDICHLDICHKQDIGPTMDQEKSHQRADMDLGFWTFATNKTLDQQWAKKRVIKGLTWTWAFGHLPQARHWTNNGPRKEPSKG